MATTPHLDITELDENQGSPEVTVNTAVAILDCSAFCNVRNMTTTTPPGSPLDGYRYIIAATASGDWTGKEDQIACYIGTDWHYLDPVEGWEAYDNGTNSRYIYDGSSWIRKGGHGDSAASGDKTGSVSIDYEQEKQYWNLTGNITTITNSNLPASGQFRTVDLFIDFNTSSITWPATSVVDFGAATPTSNSGGAEDNKLMWVKIEANSAKAFAYEIGLFTP